MKNPVSFVHAAVFGPLVLVVLPGSAGILAGIEQYDNQFEMSILFKRLFCVVDDCDSACVSIRQSGKFSFDGLKFEEVELDVPGTISQWKVFPKNLNFEQT